MAEELIDKFQKTIIEGDEKMKKMSVDYVLENGQCAYLDEIHSHFPDISEDDLFLMIMVEGSACGSGNGGDSGRLGIQKITSRSNL